MENQTLPQTNQAVNNLTETVGKVAQQQVDMITNGVKSATASVEPLSKMSIEMTVNVINTVNQVLQNLSAALAPKK